MFYHFNVKKYFEKKVVFSGNLQKSMLYYKIRDLVITLNFRKNRRS